MLRISEYQISLKLMKLEGRESEQLAITEFEPKEPHLIIIIIIIIIISKVGKNMKLTLFIFPWFSGSEYWKLTFRKFE